MLIDPRVPHPCGECRALVDVTEGCPHWKPLGKGGPGRPKGSRNKVTRGHRANCLCAKCSGRRGPTVADMLGPSVAAAAVRDGVPGA